MDITQNQLYVMLESTLCKSGYSMSLYDFLRICHKADIEAKKPNNRLLVKVMNTYMLNKIVKILV
jgi:hypothetical protein